MERFENKIVVITGAGDIATATARRLLSEGAKVAMVDFSQNALAEAQMHLKRLVMAPTV